MQLIDFINSLSEPEQDAYATRAGTTGKYLSAHIKYARKVDRPDLITGLAEASNDQVSVQEVVDHFYKNKISA